MAFLSLLITASIRSARCAEGQECSSSKLMKLKTGKKNNNISLAKAETTSGSVGAGGCGGAGNV